MDRAIISQGALVPHGDKTIAFHLLLNHSAQCLELRDIDKQIHPEHLQ